MWNPGEIIVSRGIYQKKVWSAVPTIVVRDCPEELVLALLPGAECMVEETYPKGKSAANRLWNFRVPDWRLAPFLWHTNRLLMLHEPDQFYSIRLFWEGRSNAFIGYYINFELPVTRTPLGVDTRDLELDIDIEPDLSFHWKDRDEYQRAVDHGLVLPEWVRSIEEETPRILGRLENHKYPFDGSWLHWMPDPNWRPPKLPEGWDQL